MNDCTRQNPAYRSAPAITQEGVLRPAALRAGLKSLGYSQVHGGVRTPSPGLALGGRGCGGSKSFLTMVSRHLRLASAVLAGVLKHPLSARQSAGDAQ